MLLKEIIVSVQKGRFRLFIKSKRKIEVYRAAVLNKQKGPTCWFEAFDACYRFNNQNKPEASGYKSFLILKDLEHEKPEEAKKLILKLANEKKGKDLSENAFNEIVKNPIERNCIMWSCFGESHVTLVRVKAWTIDGIGASIKTHGPMYYWGNPYPIVSPNSAGSLQTLVVQSTKKNAKKGTTRETMMRDIFERKKAELNNAGKANLIASVDAVDKAIEYCVNHGYIRLENENYKFIKDLPKNVLTDASHKVNVEDDDNHGLNLQASRPIDHIKDSPPNSEAETARNEPYWDDGSHALLLVGASSKNKCVYIRNSHDPAILFALRLEDFHVSSYAENKDGIQFAMTYKS